jgi:hypothetical protein
MDRCIRKHRKKMKQKIHNLRSTNPKEYWKIINSGRKQISPNISINYFFSKDFVCSSWGTVRLNLSLRLEHRIFCLASLHSVSNHGLCFLLVSFLL